MKKKVILVTGASSDIGKATVRLLHQEGHIVYGIGRRAEAMQDLQEAGVNVKTADVTNENTLKEIMKEILSKHNCIDALVNNAGINILGSIEETPAKEAKRLFEVNVFAYARLIQLALPHMRKQGTGTIINVGSVAGFIAIPGNGWYCASKFALEALTDTLRMEVRPLGIKVVLIEPEVIKTNIGARSLHSLKQYPLIEDYSYFMDKWPIMVPRSMAIGVSPEKVAKVILKALYAKRSYTRYYVPTYSYIIPFLKRLLPYSWIDRLTILIMRIKSR